MRITSANIYKALSGVSNPLWNKDNDKYLVSPPPL